MPTILNSESNHTDHRASAENVLMRKAFQEWLSSGNAKKLSPSVCISCFDRAIEQQERTAEETYNRIIEQNLYTFGAQNPVNVVRNIVDSACDNSGYSDLRFGGVSGESLMHLLDLKGICLSTGSACASGNEEPSHVLLALGLTEQQAKSSIRISYGRYNTMDEVNIIITTICDAYNKIRVNQ